MNNNANDFSNLTHLPRIEIIFMKILSLWNIDVILKQQSEESRRNLDVTHNFLQFKCLMSKLLKKDLKFEIP